MSANLAITGNHHRQREVAFRSPDAPDQQRSSTGTPHTCTPSGCTFEPSAGKKTSGDGKPCPPCLANLLLDPENPAFFELTPEHVDCPWGAPGSCLDAFKTHVKETVGTEAFLRALGHVDKDQLTQIMGQALTAQGLDGGAAFDMCCMAAKAGLTLLSDEVSDSVQTKMQTLGAIADLVMEDEQLQEVVLARVCSLNDPQKRCELLAAMGIGNKAAEKISALLSPWIPQEVTSPTSQSASDVKKAGAVLVHALSDVKETLASLEQEVKYWQVSSSLDMLADFSPEVKQVFVDLGIGGPSKTASNVLSTVVDVHVANVAARRAIDMEVKFVIGAATGLASLGGLTGVVTALAAAGPSLAADGLKLKQMSLLENMGISTQEDLQQARVELMKDFLELCAAALP